MGLGKTVEIIALVLANKPEVPKRTGLFHYKQDKPERKEQTTLIVAPVAVLDQWYYEVLLVCAEAWRGE